MSEALIAQLLCAGSVVTLIAIVIAITKIKEGLQ